uniref:Rho-GAP domain-containing protein n=1 Tax=Amphimedon queenslandica TaxID=400682 RepID=A0A1X7UHY6_AMPQE
MSVSWSEKGCHLAIGIYIHKEYVQIWDAANIQMHTRHTLTGHSGKWKSQYGAFISAARDIDVEQREERMKELIKNLPELHYYTLGYLIKHLNRIEAHSTVNK